MVMARSLTHIFFLLLLVSTVPATRDLPDVTDNLDEACDETQFPDLCVRSLTVYPESRTASPRRLAELSVLAALDTGMAAAAFAHDELDDLKDDDDGLLIRCLDSCSSDVEEAVAHLSALSREPTDAKFLEVRDWLSATLGGGAGDYQTVCRDVPDSDVKDAAVGKSVEFDMMLRVTLDLITEASDFMSANIALPPLGPAVAPSPAYGPAYGPTPSYGGRSRPPAPPSGARKPRAPAPAPSRGYGHRRSRAPAPAPSPFRGYGHRRPRAPAPSPRRRRAPAPSPFGSYGSSAGAPSYGAPSYGARRPRAPAPSPSYGAAHRPRAPAPTPSRAPAPSPSYGATRRPRAPAPSPFGGLGSARRPRAPAPSPFGGLGSARRPRAPAPSPLGSLGSARQPRAPAPSPFLGYSAPAGGPAYGARRPRAPAPSYVPSRPPKPLTYTAIFQNDETT